MTALTIPTGYGLWSLHLQHTGIQHTAIITLGFKVATPPYTQAQTTAAGIAFATALQPLYDSEVLFSRIVANIGNDGPPIRYESLPVMSGTRASQGVLPPNLTYLIRKSTAFGGRRYRGRMYLPFVSSSDTGSNQTGQLAAAGLVLLNARAAAISSGMVGAGPNSSELTLLHSVGSSTLPSPTTITELQADDYVATQRRRLVRQ